MRYAAGAALACLILAVLWRSGWLLRCEPAHVIGGFAVACWIVAGWLAWRNRP